MPADPPLGFVHAKLKWEPDGAAVRVKPLIQPEQLTWAPICPLHTVLYPHVSRHDVTVYEVRMSLHVCRYIRCFRLRLSMQKKLLTFSGSTIKSFLPTDLPTYRGLNFIHRCVNMWQWSAWSHPRKLVRFRKRKRRNITVDQIFVFLPTQLNQDYGNTNGWIGPDPEIRSCSAGNPMHPDFPRQGYLRSWKGMRGRNLSCLLKRSKKSSLTCCDG